MALGAQVRSFAKTVEVRWNVFIKELVGQIALSLIIKSPVGDPSTWKQPVSVPKGYRGGRFKANWRLGIGSINSDVSPPSWLGGYIDPDGGPTLDKIVGSIPDDAGGKIYFITNSLAYAIALENGHSHTQAPLGMVTRTIIEMHDFISKAAVKARAINGRSIEF